jgi:hypothetical protein
MLTFRQFVTESNALKNAAAIGFGLKIRSLNQQVLQDRNATKVEKALSQQLWWLASLVGLGVILTGRESK